MLNREYVSCNVAMLLIFFIFSEEKFNTMIMQEINLFPNYIEYDLLSIFHSKLSLLDIAGKRRRSD